MTRRGALHVIIALLLASGVIRLGANTGAAFANEDPTPSVPEVCEADSPPALLEALDAREARIEERELRLVDRMQALRVAEVEIETRLQELTAAEERLSATITRVETASEEDLVRLVAVYENMKPGDAAALFQTMAPEFAAGFIARMAPESAAAILTGLEPETAYSISAILAGRNANAPTE
ncbi:MotE family protein [Pelagovum pacificum]|uniref:Magnesium transporter MgtE intracellular domain-containing protein n=1 Tax=Pelagovum pacificum TaxID=2588711 RepID=A0A5C5GI33_9RHOB|nr:hypothetical protein [Pelagovum pacificum]QQA42971.1 hypothetical protein I8N54_19740 [Pelagovum pacificum]TNY33884.1 hypothetical protein FHY64_11655 [Pelagovum pacificum]